MVHVDIPLSLRVSIANIPCGKCLLDNNTQQEVNILNSVQPGELPYTKELVNMYHNLLHHDVYMGKGLLYYKEARYLASLKQ